MKARTRTATSPNGGNWIAFYNMRLASYSRNQSLKHDIRRPNHFPLPATTRILPSSASLCVITTGRYKHATGSANFMVIRNTNAAPPPEMAAKTKLKRPTESSTDRNHRPMFLAAIICSRHGSLHVSLA